MATGVQTPLQQARPVDSPNVWNEIRRNRTSYVYLLPAFIIMGVVTFYPLFFQLYMSFTDYGIRSLNPNSATYLEPNWVGFQNYLNILTGNLPQIPNFDFFRMLAFNLWWTFSNVIIHVGLGILIAVILNTEGLRFRSIYRAIYVLPMVIPALVIANVWRAIFDVDNGAMNQMLASIGNWFGMEASQFRIRWLEEVRPPIPGIPLPLSYFAMLITNIWLGWPFMTIVATGALQSIPKDLYEAASMDGASGRQQFFNITLPLLRPAMVPAAMYGMITTFNLFHIIYFMSGGGPLRQTEILVTTAYRLVNEQRLYGVAAAFSVFIFFVLLILTLLTNRVTRATERYDA